MRYIIQACLRFVIVVFPDHTHLLFLLGALGTGSEEIIHEGRIYNKAW